MKLLSPRLDVVFKMLFADPKNRHLLVSLLTAVLQPSSPISEVVVVDPEIPKDLADDKGVRLDVLVKLQDGTTIDVEMECDVRRARGERWLYHWAKLFVGTLRRGDGYEQTTPVVCIVFLDARTSERTRFHSIYRASELHDQRLLSNALSIHIVELPRIEQARAEHETLDLERWARFLRVTDQGALDSLAAESPTMAEAKTALEFLSREPSAQRIAEMRREAEMFRRMERAEDLAEGHARGLAEGRAEGLAETIVLLCEVLGIELDGRRTLIDGWNEEQRRRAVDWLRTHRTWPDAP